VTGNLFRGAEGFTRRSDKEFVQFLFIAMSSAAEVQSHLYVALDQHYQFREIYDQANKTAMIISGLVKYLRTKNGLKINVVAKMSKAAEGSTGQNRPDKPNGPNRRNRRDWPNKPDRPNDNGNYHVWPLALDGRNQRDRRDDERDEIDEIDQTDEIDLYHAWPQAWLLVKMWLVD